MEEDCRDPRVLRKVADKHKLTAKEEAVLKSFLKKGDSNGFKKMQEGDIEKATEELQWAFKENIALNKDDIREIAEKNSVPFEELYKIFKENRVIWLKEVRENPIID